MALSMRSFRIFSAVEVLREGNADIRFALAPLFQADLSKFDGEVFDATKLANEINSQYRLNVSRDVIEELIPVFGELRWIDRLPANSAAYVVTCPKDDQVAIHGATFEARARDLAAAFRLFINDLSPLSQVNQSDSELVDALVDWLISLDVLSENDLNIVSQVEKIGTKLVYNVITPDEIRSDDIAYLCARFVQKLVKEKSEFSPFLIELAGVGLITEVIRDFYKPSTAISKTDLAVYLDAPVALDLLGLSGRDAKDNIKAITDKVTGLGGSVRIYRLSVEEMQTSLNALLGRLPQDREGPTADALRRGEVLDAFVRQVAAQPDALLLAANVRVADQDINQFPGDHKFFTGDALNDLYSQIGWVKEDTPRFHDAAVAAMTMRKRRGARSSDIFETKHILVTRNPFYPATARRTAQLYSYINAQQVGPVVHQRQLATSVWLRAGFSKTDETIPRRYILSACRRVLTLRRNIVQKVRQVGETLSHDQAEQLELLLTQARSVQVLMDKTLGAENVIDSTNIVTLVDEMKRALIADIRLESEAEVKRVKKAAKEAQAETQRALEQKNASLVEIEADLQKERNASLVVTTSAIAAVVRRTNKRIQSRQRLTLLGCAAAVVAAETLGFYGSGFEGLIQTTALLAVIVVSLGLLLKEAVLPKLIEPIFRRIDAESIWREAQDSGLNPEVVERSVTYERGLFIVHDRG